MEPSVAGIVEVAASSAVEEPSSAAALVADRVVVVAFVEFGVGHIPDLLLVDNLRVLDTHKAFEESPLAVHKLAFDVVGIVGEPLEAAEKGVVPPLAFHDERGSNDQQFAEPSHDPNPCHNAQKVVMVLVQLQ